MDEKRFSLQWNVGGEKGGIQNLPKCTDGQSHFLVARGAISVWNLVPVKGDGNTALLMFGIRDFFVAYFDAVAPYFVAPYV